MIRVLVWSVPIAAACAALVLALPAYPQDMTPHEGTGAAVGSITITNEVTGTVHTRRTFKFGSVEVVVHYESTPNYAPPLDPRDIITVTVPPGYVAVPSDVLIPEGETIEIVIYEALLG